jgi:hypothetical protein
MIVLGRVAIQVNGLNRWASGCPGAPRVWLSAAWFRWLSHRGFNLSRRIYYGLHLDFLRPTV